MRVNERNDVCSLAENMKRFMFLGAFSNCIRTRGRSSQDKFIQLDAFAEQDGECENSRELVFNENTDILEVQHKDFMQLGCRHNIDSKAQVYIGRLLEYVPTSASVNLRLHFRHSHRAEAVNIVAL